MSQLSGDHEAAFDTQIGRWPRRCGSAEGHIDPDAPFVVFKIEDTHYRMDVQKSMLDVLEHLQKRFGVNALCLEGAEGPFGIERYKSVLTPEDLPRLRDALKDKTVTAAEYVALTSDAPFHLYGVDDASLYAQHREALARAYLAYDVVEQLGPEFDLLSVIKQRVEVDQERTFGPALMTLCRALSAYESGELGLGPLVRDHLAKDAARVHGSFPELTRFVHTLQVEQELDFKQVELERSRIIEDVVAALDAPRVTRARLTRIVRAGLKLEGRRPDEAATLSGASLVRRYRALIGPLRDELLEISLQHRAGEGSTSDVYVRLLELANLVRLDLARYSHLVTYTQYVVHAERIDRRGMMHQVQRATETAVNRVATTPRELKLTAARRAVTGAEKLCRLEQGPDDADRFVSEFGPLTLRDLLGLPTPWDSPSPSHAEWVQALDEVEAVVAASGVSKHDLLFEPTPAAPTAVSPPVDWVTPLRAAVLGIDLTLDAAYRFYELAPLRATAMAQNTLLCMKEHGATRAALVSGGFHTTQIVDVLEREGVSYVVILPQTEDTGTTRSGYLHSFVGEHRHSLIHELDSRLERRAAARPRTRRRRRRRS